MAPLLLLGFLLGVPVECRQNRTAQPTTLIGEAVWPHYMAVVSSESLAGFRCHSLIYVLSKSCTCFPSCAHCLSLFICKVGILRMPLPLNVGRIRYIMRCKTLRTLPGRNMHVI